MAVVLVLTSATACSSDGAGLPIASPSSSPSATADPSAELFGNLRAAAKSVRNLRFDESLQLRDQNTDESLAVAGTGEVTFSEGRFSSIRMAVQADDARGEVIFADRTIFLRLLGQNSSAGRPWVRADSPQAGKYTGILVAYQLLLSPVSPAFLSAQEPGVTNVRKRLPITQGGTSVTPFAMDVNPAKVGAPATLLKKVQGALGQLSTAVQVDEQGRPVTLNTNGNNSGAYLRLGVSYSEYDSPVTITAPPASQVDG